MEQDKTSATASVVQNRSPVLSIIIVNYNVKEFVEQLLLSLQKALSGLPSEIIVVDNASSDGSAELIRERYPDIRLIANSDNLGFAKASNQGLEKAGGEFLVLLNPDTIVQEDTFTKMLDFFSEHPKAGMAGCKILNPDGTLQLACRRSFPTPWISFTRLSGLSVLFPKSKLFGKYNLTYLEPGQSHQVDAVSGSFMMVRREAMQDVGLLDESFFLYGEDLDWCYRFLQAGWQVWYYPGTQIIHFKGESSKRAEFDNLRTFYRAMNLFVQKHFRHKYFFMPYWLLAIAIWIRGGIAFVLKVLTSSAVAVPALDFVLLILSLFAGVYFRFENFAHLSSFLPVITGYTVIWLIMLKVFGSYSRHKFSVSTAGLAIIAGFVLNSSLTFFFKQYAFSRAVVLYGGISCLLTICGWRLLMKLLQQVNWVPFTGTLGKTLLGKRTLVVGDIQSGEKLIRRLSSNIDSGYYITGFVSTNGEHTGQLLSGVKVIGGLPDLHTIIAKQNIQEVIFSTHELSYDKILGIISRSENQRVNFKLIPSNLDVIIGKASIDRIDDMPLLEIDYKLHRLPYRILKRTFDLTLTFLLAIFVTPIYICKKYILSHSLLRKSVIGKNETEIVLKEFNSGRDTIFDKIPYFRAILKGEISFVGRELIPFSASDELPKYSYDLKPGLTGLVQINSRKELSKEEKTRYNLYYLKNYSPLLDLEILFKAIFKL